MAWKVMIGGDDWTNRLDAGVQEAELSLSLTDRNTFNFGVTVTNADTLPNQFDEVLVYKQDGVTLAFGGLITRRGPIGDLARGSYRYTAVCECSDYSIYADWSYIPHGFGYPYTVTLKQMLQAIVNGVLARYGVTLDATQVNGPNLPYPIGWSNVRCSDALRQLSDITAGLGDRYVWTITPEKKLRMYVPSGAAVYGITSSDTHCRSLTWRDSDQTPANSVSISFGADGPGERIVHQWTGNGVSTTFSLAGRNARASSEWPGVVNIGGTIVEDAPVLTEAARPAYGFLRTTNNFGDTETVTIDGKVYTFQTVLTNVDGHVLIGANADESLSNLIAAITGGAGSGTVYAAATTTHTTVTALVFAASMMKAQTIVTGIASNGKLVSTTAANASWIHEGSVEIVALRGGTDAVYSPSDNISVSGGTNYPLYPPGEGGTDGIEWDYRVAEGTLTFNGTSASLIPNGTSIVLGYIPLLPFTITRSTGEQPEIEYFDHIDQQVSYNAAAQIVVGVLSKMNRRPKEIDLESVNVDWQVGKFITLDLSPRLAAADYQIASVTITLVDDLYWLYTVHAVETETVIDTPLDEWRKLLGATTSSGSGGSTTLLGGGLPSGGGTGGGASGTGHRATLGTNRRQTVLTSSYLPVPDYLPWVCPADGTYRFRAEIWAQDAGIDVRAAVYDITTTPTLVTGAESSYMTSTTAVEVTIVVACTKDHKYQLRVKSNPTGRYVGGLGQVESI